ncbi:hypothetical protein [Caulobacter segnis]|uniref:Uncharacterized protein n=1 Tax=Caulobacter segnis (strain ATCC 21756 / DSM 7131 / JCM 7823 / NBRC 15250 / LMG 17158 / TK0059) TaxID=509190 RepID=D5VPI1_CAUST|nr:hypothetical protein [Caulobacter segnis]ADG12404.1 hypothetical protein Cseg_3988 [Caulobacter segnis ATCC 21756]
MRTPSAPYRHYAEQLTWPEERIGVPREMVRERCEKRLAKLHIAARKEAPACAHAWWPRGRLHQGLAFTSLKRANGCL